MPHGATILAPLGLSLSDTEAQFFREADPWGFILFARNVETPDQLRALTDALRTEVGRHAPIFVDQEGGRVQRMRAPHWREYLPALDQMQRASDPIRAQWLRNRLIAAELMAVGIDGNCAPLADVLEPETHAVLANRLYGASVEAVVDAARTCAEAFCAGGVLPVLKHLPGYGRAYVDSHVDVPRVSASIAELWERDFRAFVDLNDLPIGMTAHVIYEAIDPDQPATLSAKMIDLIRREIGFDGLLMTDDISMGALSGSLSDRTTSAITAGCDIVLHCNGVLSEMQDVVAAAGTLIADSMRRADQALTTRQPASPIDISTCAAELEALLA
ncbi:glycoside hydrolase family 3 N-terminal domain-containing protein [Cognatiyoonia sp.]|uniref:glycoside hydrolase family 3 N-terminal domain-containing protein n=1 Tax=Cognatiyoonia sp. TaxID=2211652 RepID=UPI003F697779